KMKQTLPKSFDVLGNIAIVNFPREKHGGHRPVYPKEGQDPKLWNEGAKKKFAQKLLKEHKNIKTVLEKSGKVKGRLRKPTTKYLAGENTKEVLYKENECVFRFNVDTTYFSPRLSNERKEIASMIKKNEDVLVMFAGVAPFSIVIAKQSKAKRIVSNEINREANKYAKLNVELNKVKGRVEIVQGDIKRISKKLLESVPPAHPKSPAHSRSQIDKTLLKKNFLDNSVLAKKSDSVDFGATNNRAKRDKFNGFDVIVMPRPQLKDTFLEQAFMLSKKSTRIYYYDFCKVDESDLIVEKIKQEALRAKKKIKIQKVKKAGEIAPYKIRLRVDFKII
ncbi:MAG: hypothetical protein ABIJ14_01650, partial [Nanoarchaeota archaeon]